MRDGLVEMLNPLKGLLGIGINAGLGALASWAGAGAVWVLHELGKFMSYTTEPELTSHWFGSDYKTMLYLATAVILPMACIGAIQSVVRQSPALLLRSFLVHLPLAMLMMFVAVQLVHLGLSLTDALSNALAGGTASTTRNLLVSISDLFGKDAPSQAPAFVLFVFGVVVTVCGLILWLELVVRTAAITAATLFLPLGLATFAWPALSRWCRRLAETIAALILSKLVVVAILVLGASAVGGSVNGHGAFSAAITGIALLILSVFAPFTLFKLVPAIEGSAANHLEGARSRISHVAGTPVRAGRMVASLAAGGTASGAGAGVGVGVGVGAGAVSGLEQGGVSGPGSSALAGLGYSSNGVTPDSSVKALALQHERAEILGMPAKMIDEKIAEQRREGASDTEAIRAVAVMIDEHAGTSPVGQGGGMAGTARDSDAVNLQKVST
ncbi:MAG: hypothetical protein M1399_03425 [Actinobacteria bacterium]|nr:hypothetical protein [Actinomycetota bacterium]MCL5446522.1 hypothetical protein [Actinomycetota bacterium]